MADFERARAMMVDGQVRTADVTEHALIGALLAVPRERFVAAKLQPLAYSDGALLLKPAGQGGIARFLMPAAPFARMVQLAEVKPTDRVLDVGAGSGYSAAVLARLAGNVVALESDADLAEAARRNLEGVKIVTGALEAGWAAEAPYDVILVNGAVEHIPPALFDQLADGGRLVAVVGSGLSAVASLTIKDGHELSTRAAFNAAVPALPGFARRREFTF